MIDSGTESFNIQFLSNKFVIQLILFYSRTIVASFLCINCINHNRIYLLMKSYFWDSACSGAEKCSILLICFKWTWRISILFATCRKAFVACPHFHCPVWILRLFVWFERMFHSIFNSILHLVFFNICFFITLWRRIKNWLIDKIFQYPLILSFAGCFVDQHLGRPCTKNFILWLAPTGSLPGSGTKQLQHNEPLTRMAVQKIW